MDFREKNNSCAQRYPALILKMTPIKKKNKDGFKFPFPTGAFPKNWMQKAADCCRLLLPGFCLLVCTNAPSRRRDFWAQNSKFSASRVLSGLLLLGALPVVEPQAWELGAGFFGPLRWPRRGALGPAAPPQSAQAVSQYGLG